MRRLRNAAAHFSYHPKKREAVRACLRSSTDMRNFLRAFVFILFTKALKYANAPPSIFSLLLSWNMVYLRAGFSGIGVPSRLASATAFA